MIRHTGLSPARRRGPRPYGACALICHGRDLVFSGAPIPDCADRESPSTPTVSGERGGHGGPLLRSGMSRFETLTREQVMDIYPYIGVGTREAVRQKGNR